MGSISTESVTEVAGEMDSIIITWLTSIDGRLGLWLVAPLFVAGSSGILLWNDVIVGAIIPLVLATTGVLMVSVLVTMRPGGGSSHPLGNTPVAQASLLFRYVPYN